MSDPTRRPDDWTPPASAHPSQQSGQPPAWHPTQPSPAPYLQQYPQPGYGAPQSVPAGYPSPALPAPLPPTPALITGLPVEERSFSGFYRAPRWRWWKPILAVLLTVVVFVVFSTVLTVVGLVADGVDLMGLAADPDSLEIGPGLFLANNVALALSIPTAMLVQWLFTGQRPRWLSSVQGRFRWGWFGLCAAIALPVWIVVLVVETLLTGVPPDVGVRPYTVVMVVGILLTTPFQAAGEEYAIRGLQQRLVASYFPSDLVGFLAGALVTSWTFMLIHAAADPWLNVYYFTFGVLTAWVTWRTGGLEAAVALHVVNNLVSEAFLPFSDIGGMFDRSVGAADATVLVNLAVMAGTTVLLAWLARRRGIVRTAAPGRAEVERAHALARSAWGPHS
nr:CPBP family intramembrane metalloprotease [Propionibacterium sp.]